MLMASLKVDGERGYIYAGKVRYPQHVTFLFIQKLFIAAISGVNSYMQHNCFSTKKIEKRFYDDILKNEFLNQDESMITLRDMNEQEFECYRSLFIKEYAQDLEKNRGYLSEKARMKATESIDITLSHGVKTSANQLWCIQKLNEPDEVIGFLWLSITAPSAWISDFYIYSKWRSHGFGSLALGEMKRVLKEMGINEVGLRVAPENASAKALYDKQGFHITGINMSQNLE